MSYLRNIHASMNLDKLKNMYTRVPNKQIAQIWLQCLLYYGMIMILPLHFLE